MLFFLLALVFLTPLAVYCLLLAMVNRRPLPVMVRGVWDCIGLLFATSGLLLVVLPLLLKMLYRKALGQVLLDEPTYQELIAEITVEFWGLTLLYYVLVVSGIALLLWWRSNKTIIYNVDADRLSGVLGQTLARLGLGGTHTGNQVVLSRSPGVGDLTTSAAITDLTTSAAITDLTNGPENLRPTLTSSIPEALIVVEPFPAMANVTLHWYGDRQGVRDEVENELVRNLAAARLYDNPAGTWFLGVAGALFSLIFVIVLVIILGALLPPPRARL